ncbi:uncharacterized protein V1516DRAFT_662936 [Lipomyces oligophaga]|uniref:uncharacterized protein n=1 Tax=Lipomyces oligophaga TaxID=45792 RepID=UPI0034CFA3F4
MSTNLQSDSIYIPWGYEVPSFPSLVWPRTSHMDTKYYLYYTSDIWRFTMYWTMIMFCAVHFVAGCWAVLMNRRWTTVIVVAISMIIAFVESVVSGSIIGAILGLIYNAGSFTMSTWIPFVWAVVLVLTVIMTSYSMTAAVM